MFKAFAAETAEATAEMAHDAAHAAGHGAEHASGVWAQPETWVAVSFLLVVGFVVLKTWRRVLDALDQRSHRIRKELDDARTLREEAQALLAEYELKQKQALKTADDIIEHARVEAERQRKEAEVNLEAAIKRREKQAEERIAQAEAQAMRDVQSEVADIAVAAARQVIAETMDERRQDAMVDATIRDLPNRLH